MEQTLRTPDVTSSDCQVWVCHAYAGLGGRDREAQRRRTPGRSALKLQAMRHIQRVAFDLFDEVGYRSVTVDRVAAVAGVSPSSIYRYFGTREMLVLYDEFDLQILELLEAWVGMDGAHSTCWRPRAWRYRHCWTPFSPTVPRINSNAECATSCPSRTSKQDSRDRPRTWNRRSGPSQQGGPAWIPTIWRSGSPRPLRGLNAAMDYWARSNFAEPLREVLQRATGIIIDGAEVQLSGTHFENDQPDRNVVAQRRNDRCGVEELVVTGKRPRPWVRPLRRVQNRTAAVEDSADQAPAAPSVRRRRGG